jgi:murein DD-endopeptidase MepM/ murein hydrolase activator NlpD
MRFVIALVLAMLLGFALRYGFDYRLGWLLVVVYLGFYALLGCFKPFAEVETGDKPDPRTHQFPTSGPVGRFGQSGLILLFFSSQLLALFNPFQLSQLLRQLYGNIVLQWRMSRLGSDGRDRPTDIRYRLPFQGEWLLLNGGPTPKTSHSEDALTQRFALDFVVADELGKRHRGRGTDVSEYGCYGQPILAAADGEVVKVVDGIKDAPLVGWGLCDFTARHFAGNHVIIRHADHEYGFYAHLIRDRIEVQPGDTVERGQVIGYCGHSGHSTEPHLHFHIQDGPNFFRAMGRPIRFQSAQLDGAAMPDEYLPRAGERLSAARS